MTDTRILLTNDDGIDAPGIASLYEELTAYGDVTVVAPTDNQSGVGRTRNGDVRVRDHPWGIELAGTPADCVAFALGGGLDRSFDLVVAGVNDGPNIGNYVVGRSGTVGAGIEAAFLNTPAMAVSAYHSRDFHCFPAEDYDFTRPARFARRLLERLDTEAVFEDVDLLNVNGPVDVPDPEVRITRHVADYGQVVEPDDEIDVTAAEDATEDTAWRAFSLEDEVWPHVSGWENPFPMDDEHRDAYPTDSDRRAVIDDAVSVTPLSIAHEDVESPAVTAAVESLNEE